MSDSSEKAFYTSFVVFASGFLQILWFFKVPISLENAQCKNNNLPRRHAPNGIFIRVLLDGKRYNGIYTSTLTVSNQYYKVLPRANIDFRISRSDSTFWRNDFEPSQGETPESTESLLGNPRKGESNSQGTKQTDCEIIIHSNDSPSSTLPLSLYSLSHPGNRGTMLRRGTKVSHKYLGAQGSQLCYVKCPSR